MTFLHKTVLSVLLIFATCLVASHSCGHDDELPRAADLRQLFSRLDQLSFNHELEIVENKVPGDNDLTSRIVRTVVTSVDGARRRSEVLHYTHQRSDPYCHYAQLLYSCPTFACQVTATFLAAQSEPSTLEVIAYHDPSKLPIAPLLPFLLPTSFGVYTMSELFDMRRDLVVARSSTDHRMVTVAFTVAGHGLFEFVLNENLDWLPVECCRTLTTGDLTLTGRELTWTSDRIRFHSIEYPQLGAGVELPSSAKCERVTIRRRGRRVQQQSDFTVRARQTFLPDNSRLVSGTSLLSIPSGTRVSFQPDDYLHYELRNGQVYCIVDSTAIDAIGEISVQVRSLATQWLRFGVLLGTVVILASLLWRMNPGVLRPTSRPPMSSA